MRKTGLGRAVGLTLGFAAAITLAIAGLATAAGDEGKSDGGKKAGEPAAATPHATAGTSDEKGPEITVPVQKLDFHEEGLTATERRRKQAPDEKVFQTQYKHGTQVVFNHKGHVEGYGLPCIDCHHTEACSDCHKKEETTVVIGESKVVLHENCTTCHGETGGPVKCDECHKR